MVLEALEALLATMELNPISEVKASIARALAEQIDSIKFENPQLLGALAGIAKEFRSVLEELTASDAASKEFLAEIFDKE